MKTVIQRVSEARVEVGGSVVGRIGPGLLVLVCAMPADTTATADRLLQKLLKLRVFNNSEGKLDHDLANVDGHGTAGGLLLVSQFTLSADTHKGNRPSFVGSAPSAQARAHSRWFAVGEPIHTVCRHTQRQSPQLCRQRTVSPSPRIV